MKKLFSILITSVFVNSLFSTVPPKMKDYPQLINNVSIDYPDLGKIHRRSGKSVAEFTIGEDGATYDVVVVESLGPIFDDVIIEGILKMKYDPAFDNGVPVPVRYRMPFDFRYQPWLKNLCRII